MMRLALEHGIIKIADLNDFFEISDKDELIRQWQELLLTIVLSDNYCQIRTVKTSVSAFWSQLFKWPEIVWGTEIKWLVQTILSLPISSAEVKRGFSTLKYLRGSRRSRLVPRNLDAIMRIKLNGPDDLDYFTSAKYADKWIKSGKYATDNPANRKNEDAKSHSLREEENIEIRKKYLLKSTIF